MARPRSTFGKLQRDQAKKEKARAKQEDRLARREDKAATGNETVDVPQTQEDQAGVLEEFARLHQDLEEGRISIDDFEVRQEELRARLRIE